jgi:hypothetical protein
LTRTIRDEPGIGIGVIDQIGKDCTLQVIGQRLIRKLRQIAYLAQLEKCIAATDCGDIDTSMLNVPVFSSIGSGSL